MCIFQWQEYTIKVNINFFSLQFKESVKIRVRRSTLSDEGRVKDLTHTLAALMASRKRNPRESSRARNPRTFAESPRAACSTAAPAVATRHPRPILLLPPLIPSRKPLVFSISIFLA